MVKAFLLFVLTFATVILAGPVKRGSTSSLTKRALGNHGCYYGYCWAYCSTVESGKEWCYTTETYSQSYSYVKCSADNECDPDWKCGGPCAYF